MKRVALAGAVLAAMTAVPVSAQEAGGNYSSAPAEGAASGPDLSSANAGVANRFYISPMATHVWEDSKRQVDGGWGGGLAIGKQFSQFFSAEISGFYQEHHILQDVDPLKVMEAGISGLVFPFQSGVGKNIYGIAGAHYGKVKDHPSSNVADLQQNYNTVFGSAGLGFMFGPISWLNQGAFRAEALYRMDFHDKPGLGGVDEDDFSDAVVNVGFLIPVGSQPAPPPAAEPPPVEVVPAAAPVDSDGDGVTDDLDKCPGTPAGEPVDADGCPLPKKAECKTPEAGQPVTLEGCAAGDKIVLRGVNFEYDKSRLTTNAKTILDGVSDAMGTAKTVTVEVGGHTDGKGSDEYNQKLSERRAASVRQYLIGKGVDAGRMTSAGYGESQPVADNETDAGRELNRRVELKITGGATETAAPAAAAPAAEAAPAPAADATAAPAADAPPAEAAPAP